MMYKSLCVWRDLQDGHLYQPGEPFPHDGRAIPDERLITLLNGKNKASKPVIEKAEEMAEPIQETAQKPKRTRKTKG